MARDFERDNSENLSITDAAQTGLDITGDLSIVLWLKPESIPGSGDSTILAKYLATGDNRSYWVRWNHSNDRLQVLLSPNGNANVTCATPGGVLSAGTWSHFAAVYNGTDVRIYIDGVLASNGSLNPLSYSDGIHNGSANFTISGGQTGGYFDGLIDEVGIFNRALSADEVSGLYRGKIQDFSGTSLKGHWPLWGLHDPEIDLSGNGNSLTVNGTARANGAPVIFRLPEVTQLPEIATEPSGGHPAQLRGTTVPHLRQWQPQRIGR